MNYYQATIDLLRFGKVEQALRSMLERPIHSVADLEATQ